MTMIKTSIPLAALALLLASMPAASAASAAPQVCTYDIIESIAVCVTRDATGRTCAIVYVGPSTPVNRCLDPRQITDAVSSCAEFKLVPLGVCVTYPKNYVCVSGHWGNYPAEQCVYVGPASASSESVKTYCIITEPECVGSLACVYETRATPEVCIPDPCYTTSCWSAEVAHCIVIVPEGDDMGEQVCWDFHADCKLWYERTTFLGTTYICLVETGGGAPTEAMGLECMDRYWVHDNGVFRIESRSSCEYEVCFYDAEGKCGGLVQ